MNTKKEINPIGWFILLMCVGVIYCLLLIIFKPFNNSWSMADLGVILGTFNIIWFLYLFIKNIMVRQKELNEIEVRKTWIEKVCEKGI